MNLDNLKQQVAKVLAHERWQHTLGVLEMAVELAHKYGVDPHKTAMAAILHDLAREWSNQELVSFLQEQSIGLSDDDLVVPALLHGRVGALVAKARFGVTDPEVLAAISCHTLGRMGMSDLDKIIFIADMIEPNRSYPGVDALRRLADYSLDKAVLAGFDHTLQYVLDTGGFLHPEAVFARNYLWVLVNNKNTIQRSEGKTID